MEGTGEVGGGFGAVFSCGAKPRPALIFTLDIDLFPEPFDLPVPIDVKVGDIDGAAAFFHLFYAVQAFSHESKVALVPSGSFAVPGALQFVCHVVVKVETFYFLWVAINHDAADRVYLSPQLVQAS